jgi:hypothetical protein
MPGIDQTGPVGRGPMTGWRMGRCTHFGQLEKEQTSSATTVSKEMEENDFRGRGWKHGLMGRGRGRGMGRQNRFRGGRD